MHELIIDFETGGFNPKIHAICSMSVKVKGKDNSLQTWYFKPYGMKYTKGAENKHKLSKQFLLSVGKDLRLIFSEFVIYVWRYYGDFSNITLKGHNIGFDKGFLDKFLEKTDRYGLLSNSFSELIDTWQIAKDLRDTGLLDCHSLSLSNLYLHFFGIDDLYKNAHKSDADVLMNEKVDIKLNELQVK